MPMRKDSIPALLARLNPFSDIKADGASAIEQALVNLGLGGAPSGLFPIGMPFYWPNAKMPNELLPEWAGMTFLKWNGATFSATTFPKLALVIPGLKLTESRGEFIRIADDGRGVDSGRVLLSAQGDAIRNITGNLNDVVFNQNGATDDAFSYTDIGAASGQSSGTGYAKRVYFDASRVVPTATENRPRNIAFNFLVRAA